MMMNDASQPKRAARVGMANGAMSAPMVDPALNMLVA